MAGRIVKGNKKEAPKISGLVVAALRNLHDSHGTSAKDIMKYIMAEYNASEVKVHKELKTALQRAVEYGVLKKDGNSYSLNTEADVIRPVTLDVDHGDACGCPTKKKKAKRSSCKKMSKPKRKACKPKKRKAKRASCPPKKPPCGTSTRNQQGGGGDGEGDDEEPDNVIMTRENSPTRDELNDASVNDSENESSSSDQEMRQAAPMPRSRSASKSPRRLRSQSRQRSKNRDQENYDR